MRPHPTLHGLLARFPSGPALRDAARKARAEGYTALDAHSPLPVHGLYEILDGRPTRLPALVLFGGLVGGIGGYLLQYYVSVHAYPLDVGGRPNHSWPAFVPVTFETTVLCASLAAVLGMLALNGLPRPHHPVFHVERFERASQDEFFLLIESRDEHFEADRTRAFLDTLEPAEVHDVPWY